MSSRVPFTGIALRRGAVALLAGTGIAGVAAPIQSQGTAGTFRQLAASQQAASAYTPDAIRTAYNFAPLAARGIDGTGQTIAMIETGAINTTDLHQFDLANTLSDPVVSTAFAGSHHFSVSYDPETTLDVEWAHALAPGATIRVYYIDNRLSVKAGWKAMAAALKQAAHDGASTVSISLGACRPTSGYKTTARELAALQTQKISVFVASGDDGDHPGPIKDCGQAPGVSYPGSDPSVVSVGGTSLQLNADNSIADEIAWDGSGGGFDSRLLRPVWQTASTLPPGTRRWVPDVSFVGDPATGVEVRYHGRWHEVGGTSVGAPAWAAIWSLIRQDAQSHGQTLPAATTVIYRTANSAAYTTAFRDILQGSNGRYTAGPGWDAVTGWGTPNVSALDAAITGVQPAAAPAP